jgi:hypothetical protein
MGGGNCATVQASLAAAHSHLPVHTVGRVTTGFMSLPLEAAASRVQLRPMPAPLQVSQVIWKLLSIHAYTLYLHTHSHLSTIVTGFLSLPLEAAASRVQLRPMPAPLQVIEVIWKLLSIHAYTLYLHTHSHLHVHSGPFTPARSQQLQRINPPH